MTFWPIIKKKNILAKIRHENGSGLDFVRFTSPMTPIMNNCCIINFIKLSSINYKKIINVKLLSSFQV